MAKATTTKKAPAASKADGIKPDLGLNEDAQQIVGGILKTLLADESVLYTKLRNYHWNVTGPEFFALHAAFEEQYEKLADVIDDVAEHIRQYGMTTPGTMEEFLKLSRLTEQPGVYPSARTMVANLLADHESVIRYIREDIEKIDDDADDVNSEDLLTGILEYHQKIAWMLRAYLEGA